MRPVALVLAALVLPLALAGCGGDDDVATDPAGPATSATPSPTVSATPSPTAGPTVGTYPAFAPTDYSFQVTIECFCGGATNTPLRVEVADGKAVAATYVEDQGEGVSAGDPVDKSYWLTINDVIDAANDTSAARVDVEWPAGSDYPHHVFVDKSLQTADEEVGYRVSDVQVG